MRYLIFLLASSLIVFVKGQVQSPNHQYNVTSPTVNSPYVASQILPCIYDVAATSTDENLQLSISLVGSNSSVLLISSADISPGFSFQKQIGGVTVYEHQFNYNIPTNTTAGAYQVVFYDRVSKTNVSIPISITAAPITPTIPSFSSGSITITPTSSVSSRVSSNNSSTASLIQYSKSLLFITLFITSFIYY